MNIFNCKSDGFCYAAKYPVNFYQDEARCRSLADVHKHKRSMFFFPFTSKNTVDRNVPNSRPCLPNHHVEDVPRVAVAAMSNLSDAIDNGGIIAFPRKVIWETNKFNKKCSESENSQFRSLYATAIIIKTALNELRIVFNWNFASRPFSLHQVQSDGRACWGLQKIGMSRKRRTWSAARSWEKKFLNIVLTAHFQFSVINAENVSFPKPANYSWSSGSLILRPISDDNTDHRLNYSMIGLNCRGIYSALRHE